MTFNSKRCASTLSQSSVQENPRAQENPYNAHTSLLAAATLFALALPVEAQLNVERRSGNVIAMFSG